MGPFDVIPIKNPIVNNAGNIKTKNNNAATRSSRFRMTGLLFTVYPRAHYGSGSRLKVP